MESIARPLRRLQEEIAWFARATEVRLLHVMTDAALRGAALDLVMGYEHHADNRALFFRLDDAMVGADRGWAARVQRLKDQLVEKTAALQPAGIQLRALADGVAAEATRGTAVEFGALLRRMAETLVPPLTHLVVVMAPVRIEEPELFVQELGALLGAPHLGQVRWVVAETDGAALAPVAVRLGEAALSCPCTVDDSAAQDDLAALGVASVNDPVPVLAARPRTWRSAGAMPDVEAPPRPGQPSAPSDADLRAAGLSPQFVNGGGEALQMLVLGAALAVRQGKPSDAAALQSRAVTLCAEMEMPREQALNLHVLGGYLLAGSLRERAREAYVRARDVARQHGLLEVESQSELALGMLEAVEHRPAQAATHYSAAGRLAEAAKVPPLAIECWRMAGQLALDAKLETSAVECWQRALAVAGALDPELAKSTSAPEVARALGAVCRKRGLLAQARSLDQRSVDLDRGAAGAAPGAGPPLLS